MHPSQERLCSRPCSTRLYEHSESPHSIPHPDPIPIYQHTCYIRTSHVIGYSRTRPVRLSLLPHAEHRTLYTLCMLGYPPRHVPLRPYAAIWRVPCGLLAYILLPHPLQIPPPQFRGSCQCVGSLVSYNSLSPPPRPGERRPPSHETARVTERGPVQVTVTMVGGNRVAGVFRLHRFSATADFVASSPLISPRTAEPRSTQPIGL